MSVEKSHDFKKATHVMLQILEISENLQISNNSIVRENRTIVKIISFYIHSN